jgi:2-haloacid dehalogenase/putative hydrolase of the HAD superfamily
LELDGIFLDLYGTLTTGDRAAVEAVCADVVALHGLGMSARDLSIFWGDRFFAALDQCNGDCFMTLFDLEVKTLGEVGRELGVQLDPVPHVRKLASYWKNPPLHDEVKAFLEAFRYPICIVSNADRADAEAALALHGICVDAIVTSEDARSYKPAARIFEMALEQTGWRKDLVIHVGDSLHSDVGGARAAGIRHAWLNRAGRIHDVGKHAADHEFADLHGLAQLLNAGTGL